MADTDIVNVRYLVDDVASCVDFYTRHFGFTTGISSPAFADVTRGNLRVLLSGPQSSAGRPMTDGERPGPGGWNRIHLIVDDVLSEVDRLTAEGVRFRNEVVTGPGGAQVLAIDPSGNLIEFERILANAGERPLRRQVDLGGASWLGRVDYLDDLLLMIVEVDSKLHHTSESDKRRDIERDVAMLDAGYRKVMRVFEEDIWHRPWVVLEAIRSARRELAFRAA